MFWFYVLAESSDARLVMDFIIDIIYLYHIHEKKPRRCWITKKKNNILEMEINLVKIIHKLGSDFGNAILSGLVV